MSKANREFEKLVTAAYNSGDFELPIIELGYYETPEDLLTTDALVVRSFGDAVIRERLNRQRDSIVVSVDDEDKITFRENHATGTKLVIEHDSDEGDVARLFDGDGDIVWEDWQDKQAS